MTELELPTAPPLPDEVRDRALHVVLAGMDAPPHRRAGPLIAVAAVVVMVVASASSVALLRSAPPSPDIGAVGTSQSPSPGVSAPPSPSPSSAEPLPWSVLEGMDQPDSEVQFPDTSGDNGTANSRARCEAAVVSSDRAADYPPAGSWIKTDTISLIGVDELLMINKAFLCLASPATVSVSPMRGVPFDAVEIVRVGTDWLGVLNPSRAEVSWRIGDRGTTPTRAPVLGMYLPGGVAPSDVELTITDDRGTRSGPVPEPGPPAVVIPDRPLPIRDSSTPDGAVLDDCVGYQQPAADPDPTLNLHMSADSEPGLWQPLARIELPGGGFAISVVIGDSTTVTTTPDDVPFYAGICIVDADGGMQTWAGQRHPSATPDHPIADITGTGKATVFAVEPQVARVEVSDGTKKGECVLKAQLALCVNPGQGLPTYTLFDAAGNSRQVGG